VPDQRLHSAWVAGVDMSCRNLSCLAFVHGAVCAICVAVVLGSVEIHNLPMVANSFWLHQNPWTAYNRRPDLEERRQPREKVSVGHSDFTAGTSSNKQSVVMHYVYYCNCAGLPQVQPCCRRCLANLLARLQPPPKFQSSPPPLRLNRGSGRRIGSHRSTFGVALSLRSFSFL